MFKLIKNLFSATSGNRTVVFMDDDGTKPSISYRLRPGVLWTVSIGILFAVIILIIVVLRFTPLGGLVDDRGELRKSVISIQQDVAGLRDTIEARNMQLNEMQHIIASGEDTTFYSPLPPAPVPTRTPQPKPETQAESEPDERAASLLQDTTPAAEVLNQPEASGDISSLPADAAIISNLLKTSPEFPAPYPVEGTPTRTYNSDKGHYGLDIAASEGDFFKSIADGVIINQEWTFNYGFVIMIQHAGNIISLYKHAQTVNKGVGETIQQGDILGTIGDVGMLSSGPHIHIEIWEGGIPQDPKNYLINPK